MPAAARSEIPARQQQAAQTEQPQQTVAEPEEMVELQVPLSIPKSMLTPGADGKKPIEDFAIQLVRNDAIVTNQQEIDTLVDSVKKQTAQEAVPDGMTVKIADSKEGKLAGKAKGAVNGLAQSVGSLASWNLAAGSSAGWAGPAAIAGGAIGTVTGLENMKAGWDLKGYYQNLKAQGQETVHVPVKQSDGTVQNIEVSVDDLIADARDSVIGASLQTLGSVLTATAGFGAGPAVAIAAAVVQLGSFVYTSRHAIAAAAKKAVQFVKDKFSPAEEKQEKQQIQAQQAQSAGIPPSVKEAVT